MAARGVLGKGLKGLLVIFLGMVLSGALGRSGELWAQTSTTKSPPASPAAQDKKAGANTASPPQAAPASPEATDEYRVGVQDVLEIHIFGQNQLDQPTLYTVSPSGTIRFPYIGDVLVVGKTTSEIHDLLVKKLSDGYIMNPQLSVGVKEYNSQSVTVLGEIARPGRIPLKGPTTLLEALSEAGLTKTAGGQATIARFEGGSNKIIAVKLDDIFSSNFEKMNIPLQDGDVINVSRAEGSRFYVQGEVAKPGPYDVDQGMTVLKAIAVAGGFTKFANKKVLIRSGKSSEKGGREVDVGKIERGKAPDVPIKGGDIIIVPKRYF